MQNEGSGTEGLNPSSATGCVIYRVAAIFFMVCFFLTYKMDWLNLVYEKSLLILSLYDSL